MVNSYLSGIDNLGPMSSCFGVVECRTWLSKMIFWTVGGRNRISYELRFDKKFVGIDLPMTSKPKASRISYDVGPTE